MFKYLLLFSILITTNFLFSQNPPEILWTQPYGGIDDEYANYVQQTADSGFIIAGSTYSYGAGSQDFWLVKIDANGNEEWTQTYGDINNEEAVSVLQTTDGGYIIAGYTNSFGVASYDFWLVKTDENGIEEWNQTIPGIDFERAFSMQQTTDGGFIIVGAIVYITAAPDVYVVKTDENGNEEWTQTYGGIESDYAYSVQQTSDGGYIIAGVIESYGAEEKDFWLIKTDENGIEEWNQIYGGIDEEEAGSVQQTTDGGYIIAGYTNSFGAGMDDVWLVKTDENGNEEWNQTYGGTYGERAFSSQQTTDEGYILTGYTYSYGAGSKDFWLVKTDENGNEEWNQSYGGTNRDYASSVQQTTDGGYIIAGSTESYGAGETDFWLVRLAQETETEDDVIPNNSFYLSNYPNPFNPETTISFSIPEDSKVELTVYNIKGQKVKMLINDFKEAGYHSIIWKGKDDCGRSVASGLYFYFMKTDNYQKMRKMVLLK